MPISVKELIEFGSDAVLDLGLTQRRKVAADNDADKQTVWIDNASRKGLKGWAVLPSLNGAISTSELTP